MPLLNRMRMICDDDEVIALEMALSSAAKTTGIYFSYSYSMWIYNDRLSDTTPALISHKHSFVGNRK